MRITRVERSYQRDLLAVQRRGERGAGAGTATGRGAIMTAQIADKLRPFGIDYVDAMDRFGDNAELYERLALKYLDDGNLVALQAAMEAKDYSEGYSQAHALKGVAGNLSSSRIFTTARRSSPTRCTPASTTPPRSASRKWSAPTRSLSKVWKTGAERHAVGAAQSPRQTGEAPRRESSGGFFGSRPGATAPRARTSRGERRRLGHVWPSGRPSG